ncbi:MAG TPA: hypothetical protein VF252_10120, partial [Gemmatimonadales bacterium]
MAITAPNFPTTCSYASDIRLALYAYALEGQLDAGATARLRGFLTDNLTSDLEWTPHFVTHALHRAAGAPAPGATGWYSGFEMTAAAAGQPSTTAPAVRPLLAQSEVPPRCRKRWLVVGEDGKPLTTVDPTDGKSRPVAIEGDEHASPTVPSDLA